MSARALKIHMGIPCDMIFPWLSLFFTLWPWPWSMTHFLETLTWLTTFEQWVLELWYVTWVFLVIRPFWRFHYFLPCDLDFDPFLKNFNLAFNFWTVNARALIFNMRIPFDKAFLSVPLFFTRDLYLGVCPIFQNV